MPTTTSPAPLPSDDAVRALTELFDTAVAEHRTSGVTWAVIGGHAHDERILAHGAAGHRALTDGTPDEGSAPMDRATISRIASMSKSFTAAAILHLRDEGRLRLDEPAATYVPEAAAITPATPDSPVITVRDLLTMSAGFVTDNPWGDRQESMTREEFAQLLRGGLGWVHRPGTGFEYSNTGFSLLGRIIDEVSGEGYDEYIRRVFLEPLGLSDTAYSRDGLDTSRLAIGHRLNERTDATRFEQVPFDDPGVYGAMAGLFSTVDDVARWVRFLAAAEQPEAAQAEPEDATAPLSAASRREMQQFHRVQPMPPLPAGADGVSPGFDRIRAYGYGLVVERFADLGEIVSHSGGYPGYGSFMAWHRDSGVGVVVLANSKYAPAVPLGMQALRALRRHSPDLLAPRPLEAAPRAREAAEAMLQWLRTGDDALADAWFADNMDPDISREERRRRLDLALSTAGLDASALEQLTVDTARVMSRAHLRWVLEPVGEGHRAAQVDLLLDPRAQARVQALDVTTVSD
ncbi:beta-lactamase family protein [Brachybacterium sp. EF45031]|uniref:serine hydrolase domain-containing protein n=1 Tax=Brachybacterium sillae TaxID=2810536 RepID=UPI00217E0EB7|nr:serine hydrolase domain-containing protein [Brachybacterium sillae]MCS6711569.1 beta-lactamase family protein [Brachybacterium sillae]